MTNLHSLETEAARLIEATLRAGADACDVIVAGSRSLSVNVRDGVLENTNRSERDAINLRAFCGNRTATATTNGPGAVAALAERAVTMARVSPEDPHQGLAERALLFDTSNLAKRLQVLDLLDTSEPDVAKMESAALECEAAGMAVSGVSRSMGASKGWSRSGFVIATSHGFLGSYERSGHSCSAVMVAGNSTGMERDYDFDSAVYGTDLDAPGSIGKSAGERAVRRVSPKQVKSGAYPIVCDSRVSSSILGALMAAINAASIARKTSFLKDRMGEVIASDSVSVVDDPLMKRGSGSLPFDGEGVDAIPFDFIEGGVLKDWVLDTATANELGLTTNGRAGRSGGGTLPSTTNCHMKNGSRSVDDMIGSIKDGLFLTETIGHGINMVTGDYSKGASGFWIENGALAFPVAEITIAGNLKDMFLNMQPANDLAFRFSTNAPTLLIEGMTIGGT